jgi:hypothetical protein
MSAGDEDRDGALLVYLAFARNASAEAYHPVVFDAGRKRFPLEPDGGGGHHNVRLARIHLDPKLLPVARAEYLGVEILTAEGKKGPGPERPRSCPQGRHRGVAVRACRGSRRILPDHDGRQENSEQEMRGKVVIFDCSEA